ncbi:uncharacterized protein [Asterias amurensis]|uniref:uncharacterized protein n=1 Tax=Asterias amurensis TaxID=7602 RepID=UPI003AB80F1B
MSMLSGLAEYIFGSAASAEDPSASEDGEQGSRPSSSMQLTYADDDWVLVDVTNSPKRSRESPLNDVQSGTQPLGIPNRQHHMEESWLVTPPPCFTAGGSSPHQLATSPMENLLIEHPSMSVYGPRSGMAMRSRRMRQHEQNTDQIVKKSKSRNLRVRNTQPPRRAAAVAARVGLENPPNLAAIQEAEVMERTKKGSLSRSKVERHNKAYHQQSRSGKRHYRQNVAGRHSGVVYKQC